uniref:Uncharacterized protein n=1 Tax=Cannabis sativa TaxID=3483 RepID=A0A803NSH0_CANSA
MLVVVLQKRLERSRKLRAMKALLSVHLVQGLKKEAGGGGRKRATAVRKDGVGDEGKPVFGYGFEFEERLYGKAEEYLVEEVVVVANLFGGVVRCLGGSFGERNSEFE